MNLSFSGDNAGNAVLAADICGKPRLAARELTNNDTTGQKSIDKYGNLELA